MRRILVSIAVSAAMFFVCWHVVAFVLRTKGPHTWFDSHVALGRLHFFIEELRDEEGDLPSSERVNDVIQAVSIGDLDQGVSGRFEGPDYLLSHLAHEVSEERLLRLWGAPPVYVRDDSLPDGYGFYLAGEDGVSRTSGRDTDDISSWDENSYRYYFEELHRQRSIRNSMVASIPSLLVFGFLIKWPTKNTAQQDIVPNP